jgi:hypothetical protein
MNNTFNRTDDANGVREILTALAFLSPRKPGTVELYGTGEASISCLFAAAFAHVDLALHTNTGWFRGAEADYLYSFSVPGIERAGGMGVDQWLMTQKSRKAQ